MSGSSLSYINLMILNEPKRFKKFDLFNEREDEPY